MGEEKSTDYQVSTPRLMIASAGTNGSVPTITLGLLVALKKIGVSVASARVGSSFIPTTRYRRVTGRFSHNLDTWMLSAEQLKETFARLSGGCEMLVVEAERPLFDARDEDHSVRTEAELAALLKIPVILLFDATGYRDSVAALIHGYATYQSGFFLAGVIAENVFNEEHNACLKDAVEKMDNGPVYLGGIPEGVINRVERRKSVHNLINLSLMSRNQMLEAGEVVREHVDFDMIQKLSKKAESYEVNKSIVAGSERNCRIAVADDAAFNMVVQDNFDLLRRNGAELVSFSPLADGKLPKGVHAVYLPSGYLDIYAQDLGKNQHLLQSIIAFAANGGTIYAEGNSVSYLCQKVILSGGEEIRFAGIIAGSATFTEPPEEKQTQVYCEIEAILDSCIASKGFVCRGVREKRMAIRLEEQIPRGFKVSDRDALLGVEGSNASFEDGIMPTNKIFASVVQLHWASCPKLAERFIMTALK